MAKFESENDPGFIAVTGEIHRWIKQLKNGESVKATKEKGQNESALSTIGPGGMDLSSRAGPNVTEADSYPARSV